jgi:hypothetical protein
MFKDKKVKVVEGSSVQVAKFSVEKKFKAMNGLGLLRSLIGLRTSSFVLEV